jgi:hypothetical protein|uniref:Uncharacterized protein n=1 Tax=Pseudomonas aeruginosa TaxID=287 RepID=A0A7S6C6X3_PSEAI|nr:hypothetical protein [Pseudomonas aeruginosa]
MTCLSQPIKTTTIPVPALLRAEQAPHFAVAADSRERRDCIRFQAVGMVVAGPPAAPAVV